jgi:hypothetical protein
MTPVVGQGIQLVVVVLTERELVPGANAGLRLTEGFAGDALEREGRRLDLVPLDAAAAPDVHGSDISARLMAVILDAS